MCVVMFEGPFTLAIFAAILVAIFAAISSAISNRPCKLLAIQIAKIASVSQIPTRNSSNPK